MHNGAIASELNEIDRPANWDAIATQRIVQKANKRVEDGRVSVLLSACRCTDYSASERRCRVLALQRPSGSAISSVSHARFHERDATAVLY